MDTELILKIIDGDYPAFKQLYFKYYKSLFNTLYYKTQDYDLSADFVQETFVRVWQNHKFLKPGNSFFSYINTVSSNLLKDHYRHQKVQSDHAQFLTEINPSVLDNPESVLAYKELQETIHHIVNSKLPQKCRQIFILSRIDDKSNDEIAQFLRISKKTVENQLYTALKILRKHLK